MKNIKVRWLVIICLIWVLAATNWLPTFAYVHVPLTIGSGFEKTTILVKDGYAKLPEVDDEIPVIQTPYGGYIYAEKDVDDGSVVYRVLVAPEGIFYVVDYIGYHPPSFKRLSSHGENAVRKAERWITMRNFEEHMHSASTTLRSVTHLPTPIVVKGSLVSGVHPVLMVDIDNLLDNLQSLVPGLTCRHVGISSYSEGVVRLFPIAGYEEEDSSTRHTGVLVSASAEKIRQFVEDWTASYCNRRVALPNKFYFSVRSGRVKFTMYKNGQQRYIHTRGSEDWLRDFSPTERSFVMGKLIEGFDLAESIVSDQYLKIAYGIVKKYVFPKAGVQWSMEGSSLVMGGYGLPISLDLFEGNVGKSWDMPYGIPGKDVAIGAAKGFPVYFAYDADPSDKTMNVVGNFKVDIIYATSPWGTHSIIGSGYIVVDSRYKLGE